MAQLGVVPVIGMAGFYNFQQPFDSASLNSVKYTCMAVRTISDYLANNENVKALIYSANQIPEAIWEEDVADDAYIASFQSSNGHWLYIPCRYITSYPSVDGVEYRTNMLQFALPPTPIDQDLQVLVTEIKDYIAGKLGVIAFPRITETSKSIYVPVDIHEAKQIERSSAAAHGGTQHGRIVQQENQIAALLAKVTELENYIKTQL